MKVLKRPMFKYGGGVKKQGIMHGMKGMQDGGPATMADATGYANGGMTMFPPMRGRVTRPGGYAGKEIMENRIPMQAPIENFYKNNQANVTGDYSKINQPPEVLTRDERIQKQKDVYKPSYTIQDLYEKNMNVTDEQIPQDTRYGVVMVDNPNYGRVKRVDKAIADADAEGPVGIEGKDLTGKNITGLPKITSNKETDEKRLKRIYEIMDVDGAKKDAAYNALIDLSQGQAIDTKDISGSINRAIGALSKRADKVTDLKDKGKAALASGTIQDMFKDKTSQYLKNARDYADLKGISLEKAYEQLGLVKKGGLGGQYIDYSGKQGTGLASSEDTLASFMSGQEGYKDNVLTKKEFKEAVKEGKYTSPIDVIIKENITEDGLYKIGMSVIRVKDGKPSYEINRQ